MLNESIANGRMTHLSVLGSTGIVRHIRLISNNPPMTYHEGDEEQTYRSGPRHRRNGEWRLWIHRRVNPPRLHRYIHKDNPHQYTIQQQRTPNPWLLPVPLPYIF